MDETSSVALGSVHVPIRGKYLPSLHENIEAVSSYEATAAGEQNSHVGSISTGFGPEGSVIG